VGKFLKILFGVTAILLGLLVAAFFVSPIVQDAVFARAARQQLSRTTTLPMTTDAIRVVLCGTSSPLPTRKSAKSCTLVSVGGHLFLFDIGPEASENLAIWRIPAPKIEAVFITHFHSDHIGELGEVNIQGWAQGRTTPLQVFGPEGLASVVAGFNQAYSLDNGYRHALHSQDRGILPMEASSMVANTFALPTLPDARGVRATQVYAKDGVLITAIKTNHAPVDPAVAYRIDYKGRSVVISGDTTYFKPLASAALNTDLLICEGQASHLQDIVATQADELGQNALAQVLRDTKTYHITPVQAAQMANEAKARMLVYTHIAPPIVSPVIIPPWLRGVKAVRPGDTKIGYDGMVITVPVDGGAISFTKLKG
jgi:ribonuclease Z